MADLMDRAVISKTKGFDIFDAVNSSIANHVHQSLQNTPKESNKNLNKKGKKK